MREFVLGVIPARSGSKGVPEKNIKKLLDKPLIAYTIEAAGASHVLDDVIVSTDSKKIAEVARRFGARVPFMRPESLAADETRTADVLMHAIEEYEHRSRTKVDVVVTLQPTQPLRTASDIDGTVKLLGDNPGAESVITCYEVGHAHPYFMYIPSNGYMKPLMSGAGRPALRQQMPKVYVRNGAVYATRRRLLVEEGKITEERPLVHIMPKERSFNIDDRFDFELCEAFLKYRSGL